MTEDDLETILDQVKTLLEEENWEGAAYKEVEAAKAAGKSKDLAKAAELYEQAVEHFMKVWDYGMAAKYTEQAAKLYLSPMAKNHEKAKAHFLKAAEYYELIREDKLRQSCLDRAEKL